MKAPNTIKLKMKMAVGVMMFASTLLPATTRAFDYPAPGDYAKGSQQWAENCSRCHNIRPADELRDDQWITTMFHMRVRAGLTGEETRNILTFLQTSNDTAVRARLVKASTTAPPGTGLSGKEIYQQTCIACHGADGKGTFAGVPDLTRKDGRLAKPDDELLQNIVNGYQSPGSPMAMPAKGGNANLTENDLRTVLEYLRDAFGS